MGELPVDVAPGDSTTTLGDWYADGLFTVRNYVVLCVSEHARVPVIVPAREIRTLAARLPAALAHVLSDLAIPSASIARELTEMNDAQFAKTASRSLLGTINDYAIEVTWALAEEPDLSLHRLSIRLSDTPIRPMNGEHPARVAKRLLG